MRAARPSARSVSGRRVVEGGLDALTPHVAIGRWTAGLELSTSDKSDSHPITWKDADALIWGGVSVSAPDPGYGAVLWGSNGGAHAFRTLTRN